jgi:hypothetical protein
MTRSTYYITRKRRRITLRGAMLTLMAAFLVGYPIYFYLNEKLTSGIHQNGDLLDVDLKSMSSFEMDQEAGTNDQIPQVYRNLDGKRVRLIGQMWSPITTDPTARNFVLVYSITNCCFNGPPKVQHLVQATVLSGKKVEMLPNYVEVTGTLHVGVQSDSGHVQSVYRLDVEQVVPQ